MKIEDVVHDETQDVRRQVGWAFVGFTVHGKKREERAHPIGVFDCYGDGAAVANAWLRDTPNGDRWEGMKIHEAIQDEA